MKNSDILFLPLFPLSNKKDIILLLVHLFLLLQKKRTKKKEVTFTRCFLGFSIERLKTDLKVLNLFQACLPTGRVSEIFNALFNLH